MIELLKQVEDKYYNDFEFKDMHICKLIGNEICTLIISIPGFYLITIFNFNRALNYWFMISDDKLKYIKDFFTKIEVELT